MNSKAETTRLYGKMSLLWYLIIAAATVALDQISKYLVIWFLKPVGDFAIISGVFHLTYVENRGAAFGMLTDNRWVFMIASVLLIAGVLAFLIRYAREIRPLLGVSLAFVLGGGIGNMIDRIAYGFVVDFLNFELIHFAVFNIADSFICIGAGLMLIYMLVFEIREEKKSKSKTEKLPEENSEDGE